MRRFLRQRLLLILLFALAAAMGVAIAGVPTRGSDPPVPLSAVDGGTTTTTATTTTTVPAPPPPTTPTPPAYPGTPLVPGTTGDAVRTWQTRMTQRGWTIDVDGRFGRAAGVITKAFQQQKGLPASGTVDRATWNAAWTAPLPDAVP